MESIGYTQYTDYTQYELYNGSATHLRQSHVVFFVKSFIISSRSPICLSPSLSSMVDDGRGGARVHEATPRCGSDGEEEKKKQYSVL